MRFLPNLGHIKVIKHGNWTIEKGKDLVVDLPMRNSLFCKNMIIVDFKTAIQLYEVLEEEICSKRVVVFF